MMCRRSAIRGHSVWKCLIAFIMLGAAMIACETPPTAPSSGMATAQEVGATFGPAGTVVVSTLDATGRAIIATQAFFVAQQTQSASQSSAAAPVPAQVEQAAVIAYSERTYYAQGSVNVRDCARKNCNKIDFLVDGQAVAVTGETVGDAVQAGNSTWFQVNLDGKQGFVYSAFVTDQAPVAAPTAAPYVEPPPQPQDQRQDIVPENCSTAVAMGLSPEAAARYPDLDRDHDGVACYGS